MSELHKKFMFYGLINCLMTRGRFEAINAIQFNVMM